jgi:hypothetical protein
VIYKFKSRATGDLIMLGPQGDQFLQLLGREGTERGIIEVAAMPAALATLEAAIAAADLPREDEKAPTEEGQAEESQAEPAVGLRQRLWPMVEMLRQAHAAGQPVVWGV